MRNHIARQCRDPLDGGLFSPKPCRGKSRVAAASLYEAPCHVSLYTNGIACHVLKTTGDVFDALACLQAWMAPVVPVSTPSVRRLAMRAVQPYEARQRFQPAIYLGSPGPSVRSSAWRGERRRYPVERAPGFHS